MNKYLSYCLNFFYTVLLISFCGCGGDTSDNTDKSDIESSLTQTEYNVSINADEFKGEVSPLLMGFNTIYSLEKDAYWQGGSGQLPTMFKRFNTGILRYPGGAVVNRYHWNNLNGQGWKDNWNPDYNSSDDMPQTEYMDVDEYMVNVRAVGAQPMIGINMGSGLKYNRVQDGINEAVALVQYCKDRGYEVKYWYLDNEPYHQGANYKMTPNEYANQINLYVPALKAVNPNIEIVVNWDSKISTRSGGMETLISNAGSNFDILEVHWYWENSRSTFSLWSDSFPMSSKNTWYDGLSYVKEILAFKTLVNSLGFSHIKLASNEWNIGKSPSEEETPTKFQSALMISEQFLQFIDADLFMANFWGVHWPNSNSFEVNRYLLDPTQGYIENPTTKVFEMYSQVMGGMQVECSSIISGVYDVAVLDQNNNELIVYLINKRQEHPNLSTGIDIESYLIGSVIANSFMEGDHGDGYLKEITTKIENGNRIVLDLPKNSLTKIIIKK